MDKVSFGKTGLDVTRLGFGGGPVGYLGTEKERVATVLNTLLDSGVNLIDTAACYPGSEEAIAQAVAHRRDEYILVTKCGHNVDGVRGAEWSDRLIRQTVDRALKLLKTDHIDVMLLHSCNLKTLQRGVAIGALVKAREAGKIRFAGYSGDNEEAAYAAGLPEVAVIETSISICDQVNIDAVLTLAGRHGAGVIAKRPIANAAWKSSSEQPGIYAGYASTYSERLAKMNIAPADLGFDGDPKAVWPEIALRFTLSQPGVHTAIAGTTDPEHVKANLAAAEKGPLPDDAVRKIREAFSSAESKAGSAWSGQT
jgi:aryl-alcohol dehydrogenase-like predicted oxidoreductase